MDILIALKLDRSDTLNIVNTLVGGFVESKFIGDKEFCVVCIVDNMPDNCTVVNICIVFKGL